MSASIFLSVKSSDFFDACLTMFCGFAPCGTICFTTTNCMTSKCYVMLNSVAGSFLSPAGLIYDEYKPYWAIGSTSTIVNITVTIPILFNSLNRGLVG